MKIYMRKLNLEQHFIELIKGSSIGFILKLISMLLGYILMIYITNQFGAKEFGVLTLCITIVSIFSIIPKFGMQSYLIKIIGELYTNKNFHKMKYILKIIILFVSILSILFLTLLVFGSNFISNVIFQKSYLEEYIKVASISIFTFTLIIIISTFFQGLKKIKEFIYIQNIIPQVVFFIILIVNSYLFFESNIIKIYIYAQILSLIIGFYILYRYFKKTSESEISNTNYNMIHIFKTSFSMLFISSIFMTINWTDIIMLGIFKTEADVGIYNGALKVAALTSISLMAINSIAAPKFVEHYSKNDFKNLEKTVKNSTKLIFLTTLPIFIVLITFPETILSFMGPVFSEGSTVLIFLAVAQFISSICGSVGYILQMTGNHKVLKNILIFIFCINLLLNYILIPLYGINGAACASMISIISLNLISMICIKIKLNFWTLYIPIFLFKKKERNANSL